MDYRPVLIALAAILCGPAFAGYAQVAPPPGFNSVGGITTINGVRAAANSATIADGIIKSNAVINVGGRAVTIPVSARIAANAPRIAAAAIFSSPQLRAGVAIASWLGVAGLVYDAANRIWTAPDDDHGYPVSDGYSWASTKDQKRFDDSLSAARWTASANGLDLETEKDCGIYEPGKFRCSYKEIKSGYWKVGTSTRVTVNPACPAGWYVTSAGCVQAPPPKQVNEQEFVDRLNPDNQPGWPVPGVPAEIPVELPVEPPAINPDTGVNPFPRPLFVPIGDPIPNPNYNPEAEPSPENQPYTQPGTRVVPSPTPDNPWRVDLQPVNRPVPTPEPMPGPETETSPEDAAKDKPETPDLCEKNPDIIACQKLEMPEEVKLNTKEIDFDFQVEGGFSGLASCPAPYTVSLDGNNYEFSFQPFCDQLGLARNLFLAMAWLSAAYILLGARSE